MSLHAWHLLAGMAHLRLARCSAVVDLLDPVGGVGELCADDHAITGTRVLCVELRPVGPPDSTTTSECYVRGADLVATYNQRPETQMRTQIYWRAASTDAGSTLATIELLTSVQTSSLDSCSRLTTHSELTAKESFRLSDPERGTFIRLSRETECLPSAAESQLPDCYLFRLASCPFSYAEMVPPGDARHTICERLADGDSSAVAPLRMQLSHQLFAERLEKGVILRARVLGVLVERDNDQAIVARHYASLLAEALPLTT